MSAGCELSDAVWDESDEGYAKSKEVCTSGLCCSGHCTKFRSTMANLVSVTTSRKQYLLVNLPRLSSLKGCGDEERFLTYGGR